MSNVFKQAGKTSKDIAKEAAKRVAREPLEILKSAGKHESAVEHGGSVPLIEQIIGAQGVNKLSKSEEAKIKGDDSRKLEELENEIRKFRQLREQKNIEWTEEQNKKLGLSAEAQEPKAPLMEPTSAPKRGKMSPAKKKQGTKEMGKQISG